MEKLLFLDRDGVINHLVAEDRAPRTIDELTIYGDAIAEIPILFGLGFKIVVVTNQPDISRRLNTVENVEGINSLIQEKIPTISEFAICYHDNRDLCECRKPKPGLLFSAIAGRSIDPANSWIIGDRLTDISAGADAGVKTILLRRKDSKNVESISKVDPDYIVNSFIEASQIIITHLGSAN